MFLLDQTLLLFSGRPDDAGAFGALLRSGFRGSRSMFVQLGGAGETFRAHDARDVLLAALARPGDGLRDDAVGLLLLVFQRGHFHLLRPLGDALFWGGRVRGRRRGRRWRGGGGGRWGAALHRRAEQPGLVARTISVFWRLERGKEKKKEMIICILKIDLNFLHET